MYSRWLQGEFNRTGSLVAQTKRGNVITSMSRNASAVGPTITSSSPQHSGRAGTGSRDCAPASQPHTPDIHTTNGMSPSMSSNDLKSLALHPLSQVAMRRKSSFSHLAPLQRQRFDDEEYIITPQFSRVLSSHAWNARQA
jgi:hypothetical protein